MSKQHSFFNQSTGSINDFNTLNFNINEQEELEVSKLSRKRRDDTNFFVEELYRATFIQRPGERVIIRTSGRKNKNEILGLTLARLIKEKYLNGFKYSRDIDLLRGIHMNSNNGEFVLVLRNDGRIVAMSDDVEQHLGKSMRSLYTQCINMFECLDKTDSDQLQSILNSSLDLTDQEEYRLVCTFRLPKGKRPSRKHEDIKTITMVGHFYSCDELPSSERLFIARCEALISRVTNGPSSSQAAMINSYNNSNLMIKLTLEEDMSIHMTSPNVKDILGYSRNEMIGNWFGRYLSTNDLEKFEIIRQTYFQHEQQEQQQQLPISVCDIFDIYTNNGSGRLTFLCQIRPIRERRTKPIKFAVIAQLIDPSIRDKYVKYVQSESQINPNPIKAEQVNLVSSSISKASKDTIMAHSPSLANMGLLDNTNSANITHQQHSSPFNRSLSNVVAPVNVNDESWEQFFDSEFNQYPTTTDLQYLSTKSFNDAFIECQSERGLIDIFDDYLDEYYMGGGCY